MTSYGVEVVGMSGHIGHITIEGYDDLAKVKEAISNVTGISSSEQRLLCDSKELTENVLPNPRPRMLTVVRRSKEQMYWLRAVEEDCALFFEAPAEMQGDNEVFKKACEESLVWGDEENCDFFIQSADVYRNNKDLLLLAVRFMPPRMRQYMSPLEHANAQLQADREIVLAAVQHSWCAYKSAAVEFKSDKEIVMESLTCKHGRYRFPSGGFAEIDDRLASWNPQAESIIAWASEAVRQDKDIVLQAIGCGADSFYFEIPMTLKKDHEVFKKACVCHVSGLQGSLKFLENAADVYGDDKDLLLLAIRYTPKHLQHRLSPLQYATPELKADRDVVLAAVQHSCLAYKSAVHDFKNDKEIIWESLKCTCGLDPSTFDGSNTQVDNILNWASEDLRQDKETILLAIACGVYSRYGFHPNSYPLRYASKNLQDDAAVVSAALKRSYDPSKTLCWASARLRADKAIVAAAFQLGDRSSQDPQIGGEILAVASEELWADRDIVLRAIRCDWGGYRCSAVPRDPLQLACRELQADKEVVLEAVSRWRGAFKWASDTLQGDPEVVLAALKTCDNSLFANHEESESDVDSELRETGAASKKVTAAVRNMVHAAIKHGFTQFSKLPESLAKDEAIAIAAVRKSSMNLRSLHSSMRSNRRVVIAAIKKQREAIKLASPDLQQDPEILKIWQQSAPSRKSLTHSSGVHIQKKPACARPSVSQKSRKLSSGAQVRKKPARVQALASSSKKRTRD